MEIKKCARCGAFFTTSNTICNSCLTKDSYDKTVLKNYLDENSNFDTIHSISAETGLSPKNIERYLADGEFSGFAIEDDSNNFYNQIPY